MTIGQNRQPTRCFQAFGLALLCAALVFLPWVIYDKGYFIYYGDFNVQQIPFYQLAHEAVRSGDVLWSWHTDLGANFIGSYSFYLLFSPFFWLTLPFPNEWLPQLMAPLLILKTACAALTACLYLERFVRDRRFAVLGALLYAFSGWMFFNIFFNHFHDVAVFFPLLLLAAEQLVCEDRRGFFALIVALNAMVNYWFFVGEAVFVVLYVLVRMSLRDWRMTPRRFVRLSFEAVLGLGLATVVVLPSVLAIMGNPRTGADELLSGWGAWLYAHVQRQPAILQSLFFPPELPARPNFFPDHGAKWASLSGWLPLFALTGVLAYFFSRGRDWVKRLLTICLVFALVPGLNSLFILLNNSYYARWFYMPVLIMCLATARALEDCPRITAAFRRAIGWSMAAVLVFVVMCGLTPNKVDGEWRLGMYETPHMFWLYCILAMASLLLVSVLVLYLRDSRRLVYLCTTGVIVVSVSFGNFYLVNGKHDFNRAQTLINTGIRGRYALTLPEEPFARVDVYEGTDNIAMMWHQPTIQAFHSIVPVSLMEFYPQVGVKRDVGSRPETDYPALRPLLSVRWLFIHRSNDIQDPMPGYSSYAEMLGHNVYENDNYIPMGFGYRYYVTREQLLDVEKKYRSNLMLRAVVLEDERAWIYTDVLDRLDTTEPLDFSAEAMAADSADRRAQAAWRFERDNRGFTAHTNLEDETLLFFSVPLEGGWSATVNGEPAEVEQVNIGFMGVRVPAGEAVVRFDYLTPGLVTGAAVSGGCLVLFAVYMLTFLWLHHRKLRRAPPADDLDLVSGAPVHMSWHDLQEHPLQGRAHLQQQLNQQAQRHIPAELPPEDQTLSFNPGEDGNTIDGQP